MTAILRFFNPVLVLGVAMAIVLLGPHPLRADDGSVSGGQYHGGVDAPDWSANADYTRQTWTFYGEPDWTEIDLSDGNVVYVVNDGGYAAEAANNAQGSPVFLQTTYNGSAWDWFDEGPMSTDWEGVQGMIGGMGSGSFDFYIPAATAAGTTEIWLQFVIYIPTGSDGGAAGVVLTSDSDLSIAIGKRISNTDEQITALDGAGSSGVWWRVTQTWELDEGEAAGGRFYLRITTASGGTANIIDSVDVRSRVVDDTPPTVGNSDPRDGAVDVSVDASIEITFDKRMDTASVENAFSMVSGGDSASAVDGTFAWSELDTVLTFTPAELIALQTAYAVNIGIGAMDSAGNHLAQAVGFGFTTAGYIAPDPEVGGVPTGTVGEDTAALTISGDGVFAYRYALDGGVWGDACDPSATLTLTGLSDGEHTLNIQVQDGLGHWTDLDPIAWTVMTPPQVTAVTPQARASVSDAITVTFSEAMDQGNAEAAFAISPEVDGTFSWEGDALLVFTPATVLAGQTEYAVTIAAAADLAGNTLQAAYSWRFTTLAARTISCSASADTYVLFGGMGGGAGYPQGTSTGEYRLKAGAVSIVDARALIRFDLDPMTDLGLAAEDIETAYLVYTMLDGSDGMDVGPVAPTGTAMVGFVHVLDIESHEKTGETVDPFYWTEAATGEGYVHMENKPWYVEGSPWVLATHDTGPMATGKIDITPIVKGWLDGRWENNGIELKDQDDQSDADSQYGDGYSWHLASREDTAQGPYLLVTYDTDKLRIKDRSAASAALASRVQRILTASGGDSGNESYRWAVTGPAGADLTASALSPAAGASVTFTAPDGPGVYTVTLACGDEQDGIAIGVGTAAGSSSRAPLYLNASQASQETALVAICDTLLEQLGRCDSFGRINLIDAGGEDLIGGTGLDSDARMAITVIDDLTTTTTVSLDGFSGRNPFMVVFPDSLGGITGTIYAVIVDTGRDSPGGASDIYLFELFDADGTEITSDHISGLELTLPFDTTATGSPSFENGNSTVLYADTVSDFFSIASQAVDADALVVDDDLGTATFETAHLSVFGLSVEKSVPLSESDDAFDDGESDSLGGGCFIGSLYETRLNTDSSEGFLEFSVFERLQLKRKLFAINR